MAHMRPVSETLGTRTRRPRFSRMAPEPIQLTTDDVAIIGHVARHRFMRSTHLARLIPHRSYKKLIERLAALYHNGYLDRPRAQLDAYARSGSAPMVYALGGRGAQLLAEHSKTTVDWTDKNRSVGRLFIDHTLLIADLMVAVDCAVRARSDIALIDAAAILDGIPPAQRRDNPWRLAARTKVDGTMRDLAVIPDAVFGLDFMTERKRKYFLVEADCGSMPIVRAGLNQTSYARKIITYLAGGGQANAFGQQLGIGNFRVLTVTTSTERIATMIAALKDLTAGTGSAQFLFTDRSSLLANRDLLSLAWISGKGAGVRVTE